MPRPTTKNDLLAQSRVQFDKLQKMINLMPIAMQLGSFQFEPDEKRKEAHWQRDKNIRDVLIHLHEWHLLLINWIEKNMLGENVPFLPAPYNWKTYGDMNVELWKKHQHTPFDEARAMLMRSHNQCMQLAEGFSNDELFEKKAFPWTGTTTLGAYMISAMPSHYDWAMKKIKLHEKTFQG